MPEERRTERRQGTVLSNETVIYGGGGDNDHLGSREHFLKSSRVMIGVAVGENDAHDGARTNSLSIQRGIGVGGWIDQDSTAVHPEDVSRSGCTGVKSMGISQYGDSD